MEALLFLLVIVLGAALATAVGTYYISYNQLAKAHNPNAELMSLLLSLCSFAVVIVAVYFIVLDKILMRL